MLSRLAPVAIAVALTASCTTMSEPPAPATTPSTSADEPTTTERPEPAPPADPPERFAVDGVSVGPQKALVGQSATYSYAESDSYGAPAQIVATDLGTGEERWRWAPDALPTIGLTGPATSTMGLASLDGGGEWLLYAGSRTDQGTGTTQDDHHVAVTAVDTSSGTELWTVATPLPDGFADDTAITVTGADEHHVLCSVSTSGQLPRALVVDTSARTATWTEPGFQPIGLAVNRILGFRISETYESSGPLQALAVDTLAPAWTRDDLDDPANKLLTPTVLLAPGRQIGDATTYLLNPTDGKLIAELPDRYECVADQLDTIVCEGYDTLIGVDSTSGRQLWQLPDANSGRIQPTLHTAFHGRVYAKATHTAVTLDTRTGVDVTPDAGIAPHIVVPGYGLVIVDHTLYAHPAIS